jgi:hypothetical protein
MTKPILLALLLSTSALADEIPCARDVPSAIATCQHYCAKRLAGDSAAACSRNCERHAAWVTANRWKPWRLNFWLRSFAVNTDKPNGLRKECVRLGGEDCDIFWHGNMLCPGVCYSAGGDAYDNPAHVCSPGKLCDESGRCDKRARRSSIR